MASGAGGDCDIISCVAGSGESDDDEHEPDGGSGQSEGRARAQSFCRVSGGKSPRIDLSHNK